LSAHLHRLYIGGRKFSPVFPRAGLICIGRRFCAASRIQERLGHFILGGLRRVPSADTGLGRRMCGAGAQEMTWAYLLSGAIALALLVYLVAALIRAEDL
jgi:K+-transporting ATPase KdpF subunit